ncbi:sulfatase-like hydrolase/transferase [Wenzhouxiangella sediminis]|uniref:sulfatase-like hydrolase/transferase n=1 Tax=Wenzhouxiangella sediminis TaxID=1792836 RepID=UPI0015F29687|nr:sulfatase-like hydrolase/transferase [Wenzhouxiangella sediminis]
MEESPVKNSGLAGRVIDLWLAAGSGALVLLISVLNLIGTKGSVALNQGDLADAVREALGLPVVLTHVVAAGLVVLTLHIAYPVALCGIKRVALAGTRANESSITTLACLIMGWLFLLLVNAKSFPASTHVDLLGISDSPQLVNYFILGFGFIGIPVACLIAATRLLCRYSALSLFSVAIVLFSVAWGTLNDHPRGSAAEPNLIVIGVDSLRPDFAYGEYAFASDTPAIDSFVAAATNFVDATTPVARTFPAWASLLTGLYPHNSGIRVNLQQVSATQKDLFITHVLREHGYRTYYATDEARFSNIDQSYGFDKILTPVMGATDFLIGEALDLPLTNVFANLPFAESMLPWISGNRAVDHAYAPATFSRKLERSIDGFLEDSGDNPVFMAIHLCLPHWPYSFGSLSNVLPGPQAGDKVKEIDDSTIRSYSRALEAADIQIEGLIKHLAARGVLDHAVVALVSDHGESFHALDPVPAHKDTGETLPAAAGHGADVFGDSSYHVIVAISNFRAGEPANTRGELDRRPVQLLDVLPMMIESAKLPISIPGLDGQRRAELGETRFRPRETGVTMPGLFAAKIDQGLLARQGIESYEIGDDARIMFKGEFLESPSTLKDFGVERDGDLLISSRRDPKTGRSTDFMMVDQDQMTWQNIDEGSLLETHAEMIRWLSVLSE